METLGGFIGPRVGAFLFKPDNKSRQEAYGAARLLPFKSWSGEPKSWSLWELMAYEQALAIGVSLPFKLV